MRRAFFQFANHPNPFKPLLCLGLLFMACGAASADSTNAWQWAEAYVAPDFSAYFPDDPEAGARLDDLEHHRNLERLAPEELVSAVRQGLRRSTNPKLSILRSFGNRLIWGQKSQNPNAIELMYQATGAPDAFEPEIRYWAVYFGLSVVDHKTPNILRRLVELCMHTEQADMLARVEWGVREQQKECLAYLQPFETSSDAAVQAKAQIVRRILSHQLNAFEWATDQARQKAEATYRGDLPEIKRLLTSGSSQERREVLDKIFKGRIELIMDDSFIPAFAACAQDVDARVRNQVTTTAGYNWVWNARRQNPDAIALMLQLSYDPDRQVRYNAVYYGLSTVRDKSDAILRRLVEMLFKDNDNSDLPGRINWGLSSGRGPMPEQVCAIVAGYLNDPNPRVASLAAQWYEAHLQTGVRADRPLERTAALGTNAVVEIRNRLKSGFKPFVIRLADGHALLIRNAERLALGDELVVLLEPNDLVRTVPARQISAIEDLPAASAN